MLKLVGALILVAAVGGAFYYTSRPAENNIVKAAPTNESMYDITVKDIDGNDVKLDTYKGKVLLIVNTASKCGLTPQYEGLQALYDKYKDKGLVVLGFPANNFMGQEPGTNEEIKEFCTLRYKVTFPMFAKISVKGEDQHPLYELLTGTDGFDGDITWNFEKFLVDKDGKILSRFSPKVTPEDPEIIKAIEAAL